MTNNFRVLLANDSDAAEWDDLVKRTPGSTPFHLWGFCESLRRSYGYDFYGLVAKENNEIVAALPLLRVHSRLFGDRLISLPFSEYGGPVGSNAAFPTLLGSAKKLNANPATRRIELRDSSLDISLIDPTFIKFSKYVTFRVRLDLGSSSRLSKRARNTIRRAERNSFAMRELLFEDLEAFYQVYLETQKRLGSPPHSLSLFQNLFRSLHENGVLKVLAAESDGNLAAAIVFLVFGKTLFWWNSVARGRFLRMNATSLLLSQTIQWAIQEHVETFDLGRTRVGSSVYNFKSAWGGEEVPLAGYVSNSMELRRMPDPDQFRFKLLSGVWSRLPVFLQQRIGPRIIRGIAL